MAGVNKVILIGRLGREPEMRRTQSGKSVTNFSIATSERWNNEERVEWHKIVLFERLAEVAKEYLRKGSQVYIEGRIQTKSWEDQHGIKRYTTEIVGNNMLLLSPKQDSSNYANYPAPKEAKEEPPKRAPQAEEQAAEEYPIDEPDPLPSDGDLPF